MKACLLIFHANISQHSLFILLFIRDLPLPDDDNLNISGYNLVRCDRSSNSKRGKVFIYYKETLPLRKIDVNYLNDSIRFKLKIGEKLCSFITLYRSPSRITLN